MMAYDALRGSPGVCGAGVRVRGVRAWRGRGAGMVDCYRDRGLIVGYVRKTRDEWVIEGNYGYGWDEVCAEDSRREAVARLREYRENEPRYAHRVRLTRVPLTATGIGG